MLQVFFIISSIFIFASANSAPKDEICKAAKMCNAAAIVKILQVNPKLINTECKFGATIIHRAAICNDVPMLKAILKYNPNAEKVDKGGVTALHIAARKPNSEAFIKALVEYDKTALDIQDHQGFTPLLRAIAVGNYDAVYELIQVKPNCKIRTKEGDDLTTIHLDKLPRDRQKEVRDYINDVCK